MAGLWDNNIVDRIDSIVIEDRMHVPATAVRDILKNTESYSNVYYKKTRLPRSI